MWRYVVVHPRDWRHRPTSEQVAACTELLLREEITGEPIPGETDGWTPGRRIREKLGLGGDASSSYVTIQASPQLQVHCGPMDVRCPHCEAPVFDEDWGRLFARFYETQVEPGYT